MGVRLEKFGRFFILQFFKDWFLFLSFQLKHLLVCHTIRSEIDLFLAWTLSLSLSPVMILRGNTFLNMPLMWAWHGSPITTISQLTIFLTHFTWGFLQRILNENSVSYLLGMDLALQFTDGVDTVFLERLLSLLNSTLIDFQGVNVVKDWFLPQRICCCIIVPKSEQRVLDRVCFSIFMIFIGNLLFDPSFGSQSGRVVHSFDGRCQCDGRLFSITVDAVRIIFVNDSNFLIYLSNGGALVLLHYPNLFLGAWCLLWLGH